MRARKRPQVVVIDGDGYVRFADVFPGLVPIGLNKAYEEVARGTFPRPVKIGRSTMLRKSDVRDLLRRIDAGEFNGESGSRCESSSARAGAQ